MGRLRGSDARTERLSAWQGRVEAILREAYPRAPEGQAVELGATVVGMFDAGARDAEVAAFLGAAQCRADTAWPPLASPELAALAARLHRAAGESPAVAT